MVTSKPKRISVAAGVVHIIILLIYLKIQDTSKSKLQSGVLVRTISYALVSN